MNSSFIEKCINGEAFLNEIDDYIDEWHDSDSANALELHEFLGMSWKEYSLWAIKPSLLAEIVNERKRDIDSKKLVLPNV
jgi:hypothetical protein